MTRRPRDVLQELDHITVPATKEDLFLVDSTEKPVQQVKVEQKVKLSGLPEQYKIEKFPGDPQPLILNDFKFLIENNRWDLNCHETGDYLDVAIKPKLSEGLVEKDGVFVDPKLVDVENEEGISLKPDSGFTATLPITETGGEIYRGIFGDEMLDILKNDEIKSRGDAVQSIGGHEGLTFFAEDTDSAVGYATKAGRVQGAYFPTPNHPNYIISIKRPDQVEYQGSSEVGLSQTIPASEMIQIIEVHPYSIKGGEIPLEKDRENRVRPSRGQTALNNPIEMKIAYKVVTVDELRSKLITPEKSLQI